MEQALPQRFPVQPDIAFDRGKRAEPQLGVVGPNLDADEVRPFEQCRRLGGGQGPARAEGEGRHVGIDQPVFEIFGAKSNQAGQMHQRAAGRNQGGHQQENPQG